MSRLAAVVTLVALVAAGCGRGSGAEMARSGDLVITEADIAALYESATVPVGEDLRSTLFRVVALEILIQAMEDDLGITLDAADVEEAFRESLAELEASGVTPEQALGIPGAGPGMVRFNTRLFLVREMVMEHLASAPAFLDELFGERVGVTTVCAKHILVAERDDAVEVMARIGDGEDVGDLASEVSLDTAPGGDLGCRLASEYVTEFAIATLDAPIGEAFGPVETQFGWHVLVVSDRSTFDRSAVEADPLRFVSTIDLSFLWSQWVNDRLAEAEVDVVPRYGVWTPTGILAPTGG